MVFRKKIYGQSKVEGCPFCGKQATIKNSQNITVCKDHKDSIMNDMRCICGDYLDIRESKYGYFFSCMRCGAMSPRKVFEINEVKDISKQEKSTRPEIKIKPKEKKTAKEELVISSDDLDFF